MTFKAMTKAEEFAKYMATSAEEFMKATNELLMIAEEVNYGERDEQDLHKFRESHSETWRRLQSDIYEFRKRMPK